MTIVARQYPPPDLAEVPAPAVNAAWEEEVRRHNHTVVLALLREGERLDRAQELAHDAWVKLYEQYQMGRLGTMVLPGLAIAQARFLARAEQRQTQRRNLVVEDGVELLELKDPAPDAEARMLTAEHLARASRALDSLGSRKREIFAAVYEQPGASHAEIAQRLGLSVQRLRQTLCEVRAHLRQAMEPTDDE